MGSIPPLGSYSFASGIPVLERHDSRVGIVQRLVGEEAPVGGEVVLPTQSRVLGAAIIAPVGLR
jgi:hypothetical protein